MWLPGRIVARAAGRHLPPGVSLRVRGSKAAARSVARWLSRQGFDAQPETAETSSEPAPALVWLGAIDAHAAGKAAKSLQDGGSLVVSRVRPVGRRSAMDLTSCLAHAGFVRIGQARAGGLLPVFLTYGVLRRLPPAAAEPKES